MATFFILLEPFFTCEPSPAHMLMFVCVTSLPLIEGHHFKDHQKDLEKSSEAIWKKKEISKINYTKAFPKNLFALDGGIQSIVRKVGS